MLVFMPVIIILQCSDLIYAAKKQKNLLVPIKVISELSRNDNDLEALKGLRKTTEISNDSDGVGLNRSKYIINQAPFSGPDIFKTLIGKCLSFIDEKYKYNICPFHNVTQEDLVKSLSKDPDHHILGIWGEWIIEKNTFKALHFLSGFNCGSGSERNVKIYLSCGPQNHIVKMAEPSKCTYEGLLETPLVCAQNNALVYPTLSEDRRNQWDEIETEKHFDVLTQKGYDSELYRILQSSGYILTPELRRKLRIQVPQNVTKCDTAHQTMLSEKVLELEKKIAEKDELIRILNEKLMKNL